MSDEIGAARDWSAVATAWDEHIDSVDEETAAGTAALLTCLDVRAGDRVLELAAGPGSLGATWAGLVGPAGRVVLSDVAPGMVNVARRRTAGIERLEVEVVDASAIAYPDASFDVVACRMGLMFTLDPAVALAEIHRVLAPGGRMAALTWASIQHNPWMTCVGMAAMVNGLVTGGPPVGPGGIFSLGDPVQLHALADAAGFADVQVVEIPVTFHADDIDAHVARVISLAGPLAVQLREATPEQLAALTRTAADLAAPHTGEGGLDLPGRALLVSGRRLAAS